MRSRTASIGRGASVPRLLNPAYPIEQLFSNFDQASAKSCTTPKRPIFWQLFGAAGYHLDMAPKTFGHRTIEHAHRIADRADCGWLLVQADFGFGLSWMPPMTIGTDRTPECIAKFFWN